MARLTAEYATERAQASLRNVIKLGRTADIVQWATLAATAVMEAADLAAVPSEDAGTVTMLRGSVTECLRSLTKAGLGGDTDGVLSRGELVGDAVANLAVFLGRYDAR
ncbi:MAG TPA: hypothetical protein VGL46_09205 [Pseudonocardiaceae bacterium]|jgi:hypothetical protein